MPVVAPSHTTVDHTPQPQPIIINITKGQQDTGPLTPEVYQTTTFRWIKCLGFYMNIVYLVLNIVYLAAFCNGCADPDVIVTMCGLVLCLGADIALCWMTTLRNNNKVRNLTWWVCIQILFLTVNIPQLAFAAAAVSVAESSLVVVLDDNRERSVIYPVVVPMLVFGCIFFAIRLWCVYYVSTYAAARPYRDENGYHISTSPTSEPDHIPVLDPVHVISSLQQKRLTVTASTMIPASGPAKRLPSHHITLR